MSSNSKWMLAIGAVVLLVWGNALFRAFQGLGGSGREAKTVQTETKALPEIIDLSVLMPRPIAFDSSSRDPFKSWLYTQMPVEEKKTVVKKEKVQAAPPKEVSVPDVSINGILWGDEPVAILKKGSATELVKKGAEVWGIKVVRIEKSKVVVVKEGKEFTLTQ